MRPLFKAGQSVVFEGDSLCRRGPETWPFLRIAGWDQSWADIMAEMFFVLRPDLNLTMTNVGVGGSSILEVEKRYELKVKGRKPDWVFLSLGTNDSRREIPIKDMKEKVAAYCKQLKKDSNGRVIYLPVPNMADSMPAAERKAFNARRRRSFNVIAKVVTEHKGIVLDVDASFRKKEKLLQKQSAEFHKVYGDGCHFSALGNRLLCGEILNALGYKMLEG